MRALRGNRIAMIFQDPMSSLNPVHTVGTQVAEASRAHRALSKPAARAEALALFRRVGIADPERRLDAYPHELSGGMRQRVMIAIAVANRPALLIADEPTTALDVTIQAQILDLLADLRREGGMSLIFITHNLGIVSEIADRVVVMYAGHVVEQGAVAEVFAAPLHPYTQALLAAVPSEDATPGRDPRDRAAAEPVSRRLPLPSALQPRDRGLHAAAGAARGDAGPAGRLHPCGAGAARPCDERRCPGQRTRRDGDLQPRRADQPRPAGARRDRRRSRHRGGRGGRPRRRIRARARARSAACCSACCNRPPAM